MTTYTWGLHTVYSSDYPKISLFDLGNKYWSGLLKDYYGPRAAIYFKYLMESLEKGDGFRLKDWRREWVKLTNDWQSNRNLYPAG